MGGVTGHTTTTHKTAKLFSHKDGMEIKSIGDANGLLEL
jgi:hypothetical protein